MFWLFFNSSIILKSRSSFLGILLWPKMCKCLSHILGHNNFLYEQFHHLFDSARNNCTLSSCVARSLRRRHVHLTNVPLWDVLWARMQSIDDRAEINLCKTNELDSCSRTEISLRCNGVSFLKWVMKLSSWGIYVPKWQPRMSVNRCGFESFFLEKYRTVLVYSSGRLQAMNKAYGIKYESVL